MRELKLIVTCDMCSQYGDENEMTALTATMGRETYESDVCDNCLDSLGLAWRKQVSQSAKNDRVHCIFQGCTKTFKSEQGRKAHVTRFHKEN